MKKGKIFVAVFSVALLFCGITSPVAYAKGYEDSVITDVEAISDNAYLEEVKIIDLTVEEYAKLKSVYTGIPYEAILKEELSANSANSKSTTLRKQVEYVFSYRNNTDYKACLRGLFTIEGEGNYYDITGCTPFTNIASGSSYATWRQNYATYSNFSQSSVDLLGSGKFIVSYSAGLSLPGFSLSGDGNYISDSMNMSQHVTVEMLKSGTTV